MPEPLYPSLEALIETATPGDLEALFASVKEGLDALKGPRGEYGSRVATAVARTEELLRYLLQVREKIELERAAGRK
jgi:hypothetical protein